LTSIGYHFLYQHYKPSSWFISSHSLWQNKAKLSIIEQEFSHAEKSEYWRQKEEEEMRRRVQLKRHQMLDQVRRDDKLIKMKEDRKIRQGTFFCM
jgi:hypothetical protein